MKQLHALCPALGRGRPRSARSRPAQPVFTGAEIFPPEEFAARRAKVMEKIGDGVAILQGTTERPGEQPLRQNNQFFYLTGVVEPRAIVTIDGRTKKTTLYLLPKNERREQRMLGPALSPGAEAAAATGIDQVLPRDEFARAVAELRARRRAPSTRRSGRRSSAKRRRRIPRRCGARRRRIRGTAASRARNSSSRS